MPIKRKSTLVYTQVNFLMIMTWLAVFRAEVLKVEVRLTQLPEPVEKTPPGVTHSEATSPGHLTVNRRIIRPLGFSLQEDDSGSARSKSPARHPAGDGGGRGGGGGGSGGGYTREEIKVLR